MSGKSISDARKARAAVQQKAWRERNKEHLAATSKAHRNVNADLLKAQRKARYQADPHRAIDSAKRWKDENPEKAKLARERWYAENKDSRLAYHKAWREANKPQIAENNRRYRAENKEKCAESDRRKARKNAEKIKEYKQKWHRENSERLSVSASARYAEQREERLEKQRLWRLNNADQHGNNARNRRAMMRSAEGNHAVEDVQLIWKRQKHKCAVPECANPISSKPGKHRYHVDHIRALINGGTNWPDNLQILCNKHNLQKRSADDLAWAKKCGLLFVL